MSTATLGEYGAALLLLVFLGNLLGAVHISSLSRMADHLPETKRKKALLCGLSGAVVLHAGSFYAISYFISAWQVQAAGVLYLLAAAFSPLAEKRVKRKKKEKQAEEKKQPGFWETVLKIKLADMAVTIDFLLAAAALALLLPETSFPHVGGMDGAQFFFVFAGVLIGLLSGRFSTSLLKKKPALETAAFLLVGWMGVQLAVYSFSQPALSLLPYDLVYSTGWKLTFYTGSLLIAVGGWFLSKENHRSSFETDRVETQGS